MHWLVTFSFLILSVICDEQKSRTVHLNQGMVRGYKDSDEDIFAFYGIPYATAPTDQEKFKAPLPPPVWSGIFEAVDNNVICPQKDYMKSYNISNILNIQEDCLIANIFVPNTNEINLPVVVYVHGGAYILGWGNLVKPKKLVKSRKVIVVTFNYRLGTHGFLCLGTKDVPGNAGMKDQVALLRWVKKNIAEFGGDPDEVTIAGYSAGASSVDLLMISKMSQGLFKRVIPESGANTASCAVQRDPIENAKEFAEMLYFNDDDFYALERFYKTISYDELTEPELAGRKDSTFIFSPCVERDVGEEMFLDDDPVNILKSGNYKKVPVLYGFAEMEGLFRLPFFEFWKDEMKEKFSAFLPADLHFKDESEKEEVAKEIQKFYFDSYSEMNKTVLAYINYFTDTVFAYPTLRSVKLQVGNGNNEIYLYEYSFVNENDPVIPYTNDIRGADHCSQSLAVLDGHGSGNDTSKMEESITAEYKQMKATMREIWLNFMTTGKPLNADSKLTWPPVGSDWSPHMSINKVLELRGSLLKERTQFWEGVYDKYYRPPIAPSTPPPQKTEL